ILTDLKHLYGRNPLAPAYRPARVEAATVRPLTWLAFAEAIVEVGDGGDGFAFDNERPRHRALVPAFALASRLVTAGEYAAFIADGGYTRPELWLSDGWAALQHERWTAPLYWRSDDGAWSIFTLGGWRRLAE